MPAEKRKFRLFPNEGFPITAQKIGRNDLCPCGSGKKVKACHKFQTKYFSTKPEQKDKVNT